MTTPETPMERVPLPPVGSILHNGSTVLAAARAANGDGFVLALIAKGQRVEFATWAVEGEGNTFWGHYFDTLDNALADLHTRERVS